MDEIKKLIREILLEKKKKRDRCLRIADRKYDTPSAYKSGAVVRCRQGEIWKGIKEETTYYEINESQKYNQDSIEQIFKNTPQLSNIGTIEQYTKYLETIFPNSKLKGIVYHGGTLNSKDRGKDSFTGEYGGKHGMYFTGSPGRAKNYIKGGNDDYKSRSKVYFALLNIERPLDKKVWSKWKYNADTITDEGFKQMKDNNADGIIVTDLLSKINITQYGTQYVVLDMDQVHILGSEQDINMFKKYVNKNLFEELIKEKTKETLRTWFKRKGTPGKTGGWIDCNAPIRKDGKITGYKACGRKKGEKRSKYPACKETPAQCKAPGKGKTWGKKSG